MKNFANFNTKRFSELAAQELQKWGEGSNRYKNPQQAAHNSQIAMLGAFEALGKARGVKNPYRMRTLRDNSLPGRPVIGGTITYKDGKGRTVLDALASNPEYSTGNVLNVARKRHGSGLLATNVMSDRPYEKAGWIREGEGWVAP